MPILSSGVIGGLVATVIVTLVASAKSSWPKRLLPIGVAVLSFAFSGFLFYIYFFVGSSRPDADHQMRICLGLAIAFLFSGILMLAVSAWESRRR